MKKNKKLSFVFLGIIFLIIVVIVAVSVFSKLEGSLSKVNIGKVEYSLKNYHQRFNMQILEDFVLLGEEEYERYTVGGILPSSVFRLPDNLLHKMIERLEQVEYYVTIDTLFYIWNYLMKRNRQLPI